MLIHERDFTNYYLGDNVNELAGGIIPEIASVVDISLSDDADPDELGQLVGAYGPNKELRTNTGQIEMLQDRLSLGSAADIVAQSGIQSGLNRSLWTPHIKIPAKADVFKSGGVGNWVDRGLAMLLADDSPFDPGATVHLAFGNRVMKTKTEVSNPNVVSLHDRELTDEVEGMSKPAGDYPTEAQYGRHIVAAALMSRDIEVDERYYPTGKGFEITDRFAAEQNGLFVPGRRIVAARVANAGIQLAAELRRAARGHNPFFDSEPNNPQLFVLTDEFPLARTEEQLGDPAHYQNPYTALRQMAVTAKSLADATLY